jgi:hypothetical protein
VPADSRLPERLRALNWLSRKAPGLKMRSMLAEIIIPIAAALTLADEGPQVVK